MPHIMLDYSANMEERTDIPGLCDQLRRTAIDTGVFSMPGIRVRAFAATHSSIADGDPKHGYIDISVRLREGRDHATRERAVQAIFQAAQDFLKPALSQYSIALSVEMRNIDASLSPKTGTIRDHLDQKG